jgi:glycosyltransferase involved in cell wall biosynthesis
MAGSRHIKTLTYSLGLACQAAAMDVWVLREQTSNKYETHALPARVVPIVVPSYLPGERRLRQLFALPERSGLKRTAREHGISVLLPFRSIPFRAADVKTIGWIPDFQHVHRPEFFSDQERRGRDLTFRGMAERCSLLLLSSQNALEHFADLYPEHIHKARLSPFPSLFAFEAPSGDTIDTLRKFNLSSKFALVANQFWRHKNHEVVIEAIRQLHRKGVVIPLVITGLPIDYRDRNNETTSRILQAIASAGLNRDITVLGMVNDFDLANLMRTAAVVIQPSVFEGWSTVIQDCQALGRPLICSDIAVHREQAPCALGFFRSDRPDELAEVLAQNWSDLEFGPDPETEKRALAAHQEFARIHGQTLLVICQEAIDF